MTADAFQPAHHYPGIIIPPSPRVVASNAPFMLQNAHNTPEYQTLVLCVCFTPSKPRTTHPDAVCVLHTRFRTLDANSIHCMFMLGNLHFLGRITASHEHDLGE